MSKFLIVSVLISSLFLSSCRVSEYRKKLYAKAFDVPIEKVTECDAIALTRDQIFTCLHAASIRAGLEELKD